MFGVCVWLVRRLGVIHYSLEKERAVTLITVLHFFGLVSEEEEELVFGIQIQFRIPDQSVNCLHLITHTHTPRVLMLYSKPTTAQH